MDSSHSRLDVRRLDVRRRALATAGALGAAGIWTAGALHGPHGHGGAAPWVAWHVSIAAIVAAGAAGISRRSVTSGVLSRGALWFGMVLAALAPAASPTETLLPRLGVVGLLAASLWLAAPALHTESAHAEFAPVAGRKLFLAGAVACAAVGIESVWLSGWQLFALIQVHASGIVGAAWGPAMLGVAYLASALGVIRMRAWGVLLGAASSAATLACMLPDLRHGNAGPLGVAIACFPGALLALALVAARYSRQAPTGARIAGECALAPSSSRGLRIAPSAEESLVEEAPDADEGPRCRFRAIEANAE